MNTNTRQEAIKEHKREIQALVNSYIEEFNEQLIDYLQKKPKSLQSELLTHLDNYPKQKNEKIEVMVCQVSNNRNLSGFKIIKDQLKSHLAQEIVESEKQPIYSANFQTYNSLQSEQGQKQVMRKIRKQNEYKCVNKGTDQIDRKSERNCQQATKSIDRVKKNIRVNNKSSPNLYKTSQVKQKKYNQLRDKTLVQYFYPKHKKIFRQVDEKSESLKAKLTINNKGIDLKQQKLVKKFQTERNQNTKFSIKKKKQSCYKIKNDCVRKITFDNYDLVSCNFSMKKYDFDYKQNWKQIQKRENENIEPDQSVLQRRIKHMQQKVYKKMPFLVEMGVKFKTVKLKY